MRQRSKHPRGISTTPSSQQRRNRPFLRRGRPEIRAKGATELCNVDQDNVGGLDDAAARIRSVGSSPDPLKPPPRARPKKLASPKRRNLGTLATPSATDDGCSPLASLGTCSRVSKSLRRPARSTLDANGGTLPFQGHSERYRVEIVTRRRSFAEGDQRSLVSADHTWP